VRRSVGVALVLAGAVACGSRTGLVEATPAPSGASRDAAGDDETMDATVDAVADDASDESVADASDLDVALDVVGIDGAGWSACDERTNSGTPVDRTATQGAAWLAWKTVLPTTERVEQIALHDTGGEVAVLGDDAGRPGKVLATAPGPAPLLIGWHARTLSTPVVLEAGVTYWVAHSNADAAADLSYDSTGPTPPYWGGCTLAGPWDGPYVNYAFDVQLDGTCP